MICPVNRGACDEIRCRYHLDRDRRRGQQLPGACSLELADEGARTLEQISAILGITRERVRQIETRALGRLRARYPETLARLLAGWTHADGPTDYYDGRTL